MNRNVKPHTTATHTPGVVSVKPKAHLITPTFRVDLQLVAGFGRLSPLIVKLEPFIPAEQHFHDDEEPQTSVLTMLRLDNVQGLHSPPNQQRQTKPPNFLYVKIAEKFYVIGI